MKHAVGTRQKSYADVSLNDDRIIVCTMYGFMDETIVRGSLEKTRAYARQLKMQHHPAYLLIDATHVTGQSSGARSLAKTLNTMGLAKIAVCNRNPALGMIIRYLIRAGGMGAYAQVFRRRTSAFSWLLHEHQVTQRRDNGPRFVLAAIVILVASCALVGWAVDNEYLAGVSPTYKPMNPALGILLLLQAVALIVMKRAGTMSRLRMGIVGAAAGLAILFGWLVLIQTALGRSFYVDSWLFGSLLGEEVFSGRTSPWGALALMLLGVMELAVLSGQHKRWQQYIFHGSSVIVFAITLLWIISYSFGAKGLHVLNDLLPMPLNTAFCLLLINHAMQTVARQLPHFERQLRLFTRYSQPIIIGMAIVFITGVAWHQSAQNQERSYRAAVDEELSRMRDGIQNRTNAYVNVLHGYRSHFQASEFVSAEEYHTFFASSDLTKQYPGISAIIFVRNIPAADRPAFEKSMRQQASGAYPSLRDYGIYPASSRPVSYPIVYIEPRGPTSNYGFDLATNEPRREALEKARDTNGVAATATIDLNASRADSSLPQRPGFFITIPVYRDQNSTDVAPATVEARRAATYGFVNALFENSKLFNDIFKDTHRKDVRYVVSNATSDETLYEYNPQGVATDQAAQTVTMRVAGQTWQLALYASPGFGMAGIERFMPMIILCSGLVMAVLATTVAAGQVRRKEQAFALAAAMTEDLNNERDAAVLIRQKDEAILSSIGDAVFAIDPKENIILFNRAAEEITGSAERDVLGQPYKKFFHFIREKDGAHADAFIASALSGKSSSMAEGTMLKRQDGSQVPVADSAAPIVDVQGAIEGAVIVFRDVTQEKELERLKNEFVSMASHELRTPMGAIRAFVSMMLAGDYGPVNKNLVEPLTDIRTSTLRLVELVNDLLDVARIEAGRMKFALDDIDVSSLLKHVVHELGPLAKEKGIRLSMESHRLPPVQADVAKVTQVVTNLVGNALKFTDKGAISITAALKEGRAEVCITDTGAGISRADQEKLFGKFQQVSSVQAGRPAGTGLGLYISREIVRKMGGELWIKQSEVGQGTTFAFTLPLAQTALAKRVKMERAKDEKLHPDAV